MDGSMVEDKTKQLNPEDCVNLVIDFFAKVLRDFELIKSGYYTGYWWVKFRNEREYVTINFDGDIGGHFQIIIIIDNKIYYLWQYDRSVNNATISTEGNILYQLDILKHFLV
jgi:hypothetical protein